MEVLVLALYAEGSSDTRFLPPIIQRTAENIINLYGERIVDVSDPIVISKKQGRQEDCILQASKEASDYHALIVHADADNRTTERALRERIQPGFDLVKNYTNGVCKDLVPLIPVQMIEAWMLADIGTLCEVVGTNINPRDVGLPGRAALVEQYANPKNVLNEFMRQVNNTRPHRRRQRDFTTRYDPLARQIDLDILATVPSFKMFVDSLAQTLAKLHFIPLESLPEHRR